MRWSAVIFFSLTSLVSCESEYHVPRGVIKVDPMADILMEISMAEAFSESFLLTDSTLKKDSVLKSEISKVYKLHNIDPIRFSKSYIFYTTKPVLFKMVMDSANARVTRNRDREFINDSIKVN